MSEHFSARGAMRSRVWACASRPPAGSAWWLENDARLGAKRVEHLRWQSTWPLCRFAFNAERDLVVDTNNVNLCLRTGFVLRIYR